MLSPKQYFDRQAGIMSGLDFEQIKNLKQKIEQMIKYEDGHIFIAGCGGSLLNSMHFAQDLMKHCKLVHILETDVRAIGCNPGLISAVENDIGHEKSITFELSNAYNTLRPGAESLFIAISVSGTSKNIMNAVDWCIEQKDQFLEVATITGNKNPNGIASKADYSIVIPNDEFSFVEDLSMSILHYIIYNLNMD